MSDSSLVPVPPEDRALAKQRKSDLSPALAINRLIPHNVLGLPDQTIYTFVQVGRDSKGYQSLRNRSVPRQVAMITVFRRRGIFKIQWYPWADKPQVIEELPMDRLPAAVQDLWDAGFGRSTSQ